MLNLLKTWIMDTFGFSKSEAHGTLVLLIIVFLGVLIPRLLLQNSKSSPESFLANQESLELWAEGLKSSLRNKKEAKTKPTEIPSKAESFSFDPNTATLTDLLALGFKERAAQNLISYRKNGGQFALKSDLKRVYGISKKRIDELWDQINLPNRLHAPKKEAMISHPMVAIEKWEINTVTAEMLQEIRGIGPVLSKRIVTFREKLGGFHSLEQLHQVYGLDSATVNALQERSVTSGIVKKININTDSLRFLYNHPYIDYSTARVIVNYRAQHGDYNSIKQLKSIKIINDSLYQKIYPYLSPNP